MPHIAITMYPGRDEKIKKELAVEMKKAMVAALGVDPKVVSVSIQDVPQDKWQDNISSFPGEAMFIAPGEDL